MNLWNKFLESLRGAFWLAAVALMAGLCLCSWGLYRAFVQLRLTEQKLADSAIVVGGAAGDLQKTLAIERKAAGAQIQATADTLTQAKLLLGDADESVRELNRTLATSNATIGTLNGAIETHSAQLVAIEDQAQRDLADLDASEIELPASIVVMRQAGEQALKLLADPTIQDDLVQLHTTLVHTAATSEHVDAATGDLAGAIHRETRPASFAVKTAGWIVNSAAKIGGILAGFVKADAQAGAEAMQILREAVDEALRFPGKLSTNVRRSDVRRSRNVDRPRSRSLPDAREPVERRQVTTLLQLAAAKTDPDDLLRLARIRHIWEREQELHGHAEKFEHCFEFFCAAAREKAGLDRDQIERFARDRGRHREPGQEG